MKVLCIGSMNLDFVYSVDHIVQPGETEASYSLDVFLGGKGMNQSVALAKAGADTYHAGLIGDDGKVFLDADARVNNLGNDSMVIIMYYPWEENFVSFEFHRYRDHILKTNIRYK